jgi:alkylation response protein AidB-like acyl-CoA dehydrogenase
MPTTESKLRGPKGWSFPDDPADIRLALLAKIDGLKETLEAGVDEGEQNSTLPSGVVDALYDAGLFAIKLPRELGGAEADLVTQMEVIEALSRIEPSAGWCTMIGATGIGLIGAHLPDEAISQIFPGGSVPRSAGAFMPMGKAETVDGGYLVNGRWSFASGIRHSHWLSAGALVVKDGKTTDEYIRAVFPTSDAVIHDNWDVAGLKGTGSCDFSVSGLFVPQEFTYPRAAAEPKRGGSLYRLGWPGFVAYEHAAFALGVGRRALDVIVAEAGAKIRGMQPSRLASRPSFQKSLGECDLRLKAARTLVIHLLEEAWDQASQGVIPGPQLQGEMRSSATFATSMALDVVTTAFRYGGGSALYTTSVLQRCLRDLNAAAQHLMVSDSAYENHGQFMLDIPDADPMG